MMIKTMKITLMSCGIQRLVRGGHVCGFYRDCGAAYRG